MRTTGIRVRNKRPHPLVVGRTVGSLTIARITEDGTLFCTCSGAACSGRGSRTLKRNQFDKSIRQCQICAKVARSEAGGKRVPDPLPIPTQKVEQKPVCKQSCVARLIDGSWMIGHNPDCPKLGIFTSYARKTVDYTSVGYGD